MNNHSVRLPIIESLILASPEPLPVRRIAEVLENITPTEVDGIVDELNRKYSENDMSIRIRKIAGGYQSYIIEDYARYVEDLFTRRRNVRLTRAALETLAIIAYRQPVTKMDIELIRGVATDSVICTLLDKKLVTLAGRAETIGRPLLYRTTDEFLKFFNLNSLDDLPRMEEIEELLAANEPNPPQPSLPFDDTGKDENPETGEDITTETGNADLADAAIPAPMGPFARSVIIKSHVAGIELHPEKTLVESREDVNDVISDDANPNDADLPLVDDETEEAEVYRES